MSTATVFDPTESRRQRGLAIAALCRIVYDSGMWVVPAQSGRGRYFVNPGQPRCSCPDFEERGKPCKHVFAVRYVIEREKGIGDAVTETVMQTVSVTETVAKKPICRQNWPAYNAAQTSEKAKFQGLLADLCRGIEEPPPQATGRPRMPLRDAVWACVFKVYSTVSGRRFMCDMEDAFKKGHLSRPVHYNSIAKHMEMPGLTPILHRLIRESSLPLRSVETDFAIDSTGFSTSRFARWFDHKYGRPMQECQWVKCHAATGVKTNVVTAVELGIGADNDSPQFIPLLGKTAENFRVNEVSADAAYASYANMDAAAAIGATPFIAFPSSTTGAGGGTFGKMFHYYQFNREDYLRHYHKRSNVESTFSMVKAKFGDALRSKTDAALFNEALCKILCHNLCCLILSTYELGIVAKFWGTEEVPAEAATVETEDDSAAWAWV
jgi:transposase/predicted nucleic acid-binding Zn finger protein